LGVPDVPGRHLGWLGNFLGQALGEQHQVEVVLVLFPMPCCQGSLDVPD
jgi:hypothetical protein